MDHSPQFPDDHLDDSGGDDDQNLLLKLMMMIQDVEYHVSPQQHLFPQHQVGLSSSLPF